MEALQQKSIKVAWVTNLDKSFLFQCLEVEVYANFQIGLEKNVNRHACRDYCKHKFQLNLTYD